MNLTNWKGKIVRKQDIYTAKNYLTADELDNLNRFVTVFLEMAELRVKDEKDITIKFWRENINKIIESNNKKILTNNGKVSNEEMKKQVDIIYNKFNKKRKKEACIQADKNDLEELFLLEKKIKK